MLVKSKFKNLPLALAYKPRASSLSTRTIKENKNESEKVSISIAKKLIQKELGVLNADIRIERVQNSNSSFREYFYRTLLLVREKTYIRGNKQFEEREIYPHICA